MDPFGIKVIFITVLVFVPIQVAFEANLPRHRGAQGLPI
jgi:hypothetical protein